MTDLTGLERAQNQTKKMNMPGKLPHGASLEKSSIIGSVLKSSKETIENLDRKLLEII